VTAEVLRFPSLSWRAVQVCAAVAGGAAAARVPVAESTTYRGGRDVLVLWGPGHPARFEPMRRQVEAGGHVLALDLAYWDRDRKFRVSIDGAHPQAWVMRRAMPPARLKADGIIARNVWNPNGPVIVAGLGDKARVQYGADQIDLWEAAMMTAVRAYGREVIYRAKKSAAGTIEETLAGASALITWHSNAAVDAIRLGVPVVCRDGAAAAVCASTYAPTLQPLLPAVRDQFLANLAYFQWSLPEASSGSLWQWAREVLQ
jgi:hypothetical protein